MSLKKKLPLSIVRNYYTIQTHKNEHFQSSIMRMNASNYSNQIQLNKPIINTRTKKETLPYGYEPSPKLMLKFLFLFLGSSSNHCVQVHVGLAIVIVAFESNYI